MKATLLAALLGLVATTTFAQDIPRLSLTGTGTVTVEPDEGYIMVGVVSVKPTSAEALNDNTARMQKLYSQLAELGIEKNSIQTLQFDVSEHFTTVDTDKVDRNGAPIQKTVKDGYQVSNTIRVTVCDLLKFGKVLDTVVQDGATRGMDTVVQDANRVFGISFGSSKASENLDKARKLAAEDALRKAKIFADGLGIKLGRVSSVTEYDGRQDRSPYMARGALAEAAPGAVPVSGGSLSFVVTVSVQWELGDGGADKKGLKIELNK